MSTPRTDAELKRITALSSAGAPDALLIRFCRDLEAELIEALADIDYLAEQLTEARGLFIGFMSQLKDASADAKSWSDQCSDRAKDFDDLGIKYKALREHAALCEEQCRNYAAQWEKLREQRDNARARVATLQKENRLLRKELRK